jgi:abortive infection bacteriophage resistance protein
VSNTKGIEADIPCPQCTEKMDKFFKKIQEKPSRREVYLAVFKNAIGNSFSVCIVLIVCSLMISLLHQMNVEQSSFTSALKVLLHYGSSAIDIIFFTASSLILLSFTLILNGADAAIWFRRLVVIPALHISGHMLSMVAGAVFGTFLIDGWATCYKLSEFSDVATIWGLCVLFSWLSLSAKPFFKVEFENINNEKDTFIKIAVVAFGCIAAGVFCLMYIKNYTPLVNH